MSTITFQAAQANEQVQDEREFDQWKLECLMQTGVAPTADERDEIESIAQQQIEAETSVEYWDGTEWVEREQVPSFLATMAVRHYQREHPGRDWRAM